MFNKEKGKNVTWISGLTLHITIWRSSRQEVYCKRVFLEFSQNSQENTCATVSFLIKLQLY